MPPVWLDRFAATTQPQLHLMDGRQLATLAWVMAMQGRASGREGGGGYFPPAAWTAAFLLATQPLLGTMTDTQLGNTLWHVNGWVR